MNVAVATVSALSAAGLFAVATAVQAKAVRQAAREPVPAATPAGSPAALASPGEFRVVTRAFRSRIWLAGAAIAAAAFGLHALALHEGNLSFVQPLLVTMVLFALPISRLVGGPQVSRAELVWALVLVVGLSAFFVAANPNARPGSIVDTAPAIITAVLAALTVFACVALARRRIGGQGAALLGAAAGIAFAGVAALVKTGTDILTHGVVDLMTAWQLYALVVLGAMGVILSQMAYRAGPLTASLPALNSVNPLASVLIGVAVFDEHLRTGRLPATVEVLALAAVTAAIVMLSRPARLERASRTGQSPPAGAVTQAEISARSSDQRVWKLPSRSTRR
jgi:drug/metabolite transporter (DMT)-like permease